jgi:HSP20 family protein
MSYPMWRAPQRGFDPVRELRELRADLGRMMGWAFAGQQTSFADVDVEETDDGWLVTARLPGVAPDEVAIDVDDRELCVRAKSEAEVNAEAGVQAEGSRRRSFEYRLTIPGDVDPEKVDATMDHGLLKIRLPRSTRSRRRQITIGRGDATQASDATQAAGPTAAGTAIAEAQQSGSGEPAPSAPDGADGASPVGGGQRSEQAG